MIEATLKIILAISVSFLLINCDFQNLKSEFQSKSSSSNLGTKDFIWIDYDRKDNYYGGSRIVNTRVWYPANSRPTDLPQSSYLLFGDIWLNQLDSWSEEQINRAHKIKLNSIDNAPITNKNKKAPLLIFSPSLGGNLSYYTYYAEYFARHGYIVMGINHLYESEVVIDKDAKIYPANHRFQDSLKALKIPEEITADNYRKALDPRQKIIAEDIVYALNKLLVEPLIANKIDTTKIAVFGHSVGGTAAIYSALISEHIKAVINLDGSPPTVALSKGIDVPFLFIEDLTDYKNHQGYAMMHKRRSDFCTKNKADSWRMLIKDFNHNSFLDVNYYLSNNPTTANSEKKNLNLIVSIMENFLDFYLLNKRNNELDEHVSDKVEVISFIK